jgi:acetyltransferase EpsM
MSRIILVGGEGFAKEVYEIACLLGHEIVGYVAKDKGILNLPYFGKPDKLPELQSKFDYANIAFGAINYVSVQIRREMIERLYLWGIKSLTLISPHAVVSSGVMISECGVFVAHGVILSVDCNISQHAILNSNAVIGHDSKIGSNVIVAPQAFIAGNCYVGDDTLVGPSAVMLEGRTVGSGCVLGAQSIVHRSLPNDSIAFPNKSRILNK